MLVHRVCGPLCASIPTMFDADYYARFYENPSTRVTDPETIATLARHVVAHLAVLQLDVHSVLDMGCGLGWWRDALAEALPDADYTGVEVSEHLVESHGWQQGSVTSWSSRKRHDLVICQGVLQYLDDEDAAEAIENLAVLASSALWLEALTRADWSEHCDRERTDGQVHLRSGAWYRRALRPHFTNCGGGLFVKRDAACAMFELEHLG